MLTDPDCVFCNVLANVPAEVEMHPLPNGECVWVFEPLNPVVPGHLLVVPYVHVQSAIEDPAVTGAAAEVAATVAQRYPSANIITSIGTPATQSVFHLHWHVVPRRESDGLHLPWTDQQHKEEEMALRKHGEGEVIPENEQQKTAAAEGMSKESAEELRRENEAADGVDD